MEKGIVNTIVKNAIKNLRADPDRTSRNLIDMASRFADSRFQKQFYEKLQTLLSNEESSYYALVRETLSLINEETLLTFSMNLGYNGLYLGAGKIRQQEERLGFQIPWTISLAIPNGQVHDRHHAVIRQGEALGIHSWCLFSGRSFRACAALARMHPDSAFVIFAGSHEIDRTALDIASDCHNLAVVVPFDKDADAACGLLRSAGFLYGVHYAYQESDLPSMESGELLEEMEPLHPAACIFMPKFPCPHSLRQQFYHRITTARLAQNYSVIPLDLYEDIRLVDSVISDGPIWVGFDEYGRLNTDMGTGQACDQNIFAMDLPEILKQAFPIPEKTV